MAVEQAERVLHADDASCRDRGLDLVQRGVGDPDSGDLALVAERDHLGELVLERNGPGAFGKLVVGQSSQVDRAEALDVEGAQVVLDPGAQLGRGLGGDPTALCVALGSDLGDQEQVLGVRVQRFVDELVRHVRPVVLRRVDVVHAELDRTPQHRDGLVVVTRRPEHSGTGKLHGAEADPANGVSGERAGERVGVHLGDATPRERRGLHSPVRGIKVAPTPVRRGDPTVPQTDHPSLLSVNVGMPKDVAWQGKTVYTGIWKYPVDGPAMVRRLNIDGDGQGDLNGHGGEQRAVLVYQIESYEHWQQHFGRDDFDYGQFGENLTVDGLPDDEVCIGDRYRIGEAEFEVTQPRVTCYRVGMRLGEPDLPALLVSHHRPGFYMRVITEGHVQAGDEIIRTRIGPRRAERRRHRRAALPARPGHRPAAASRSRSRP